MGLCNIAELPFLRPAAQQNHQIITVLAEIQPVSGTEVDPEFKYSSPYALAISEVAKLHSVYTCLDSGSGLTM